MNEVERLGITLFLEKCDVFHGDTFLADLKETESSCRTSINFNEYDKVEWNRWKVAYALGEWERSLSLMISRVNHDWTAIQINSLGNKIEW